MGLSLCPLSCKSNPLNYRSKDVTLLDHFAHLCMFIKALASLFCFFKPSGS